MSPGALSLGRRVALTVIANGKAVVELDSKLFSERVVLRAAHLLTDTCEVAISPPAAETGAAWIVTLAPKMSITNIEREAGRLRNEALDAALRERIAAETAAERWLIVRQAFSRGNLELPILDDANPQDDPLNLRLPDAETGRRSKRD